VAKHKEAAERLLQVRRDLACERLQFQEEQTRVLERQAETRAALEGLRRETLDLLRQIPERGLDGGDVLRTLGAFRDQVRGHLSNMAGGQDRGAVSSNEPAGPRPHRTLEAANTLVPKCDESFGPMLAWYRQKLGGLCASAPAGAALDLAKVDPRDVQLAAALQELGLVDGDSLATLHAEARRQRRSLRQMLIASSLLTTYQLTRLEARDLASLQAGPVWLVDRIRATPFEIVYRVFDPRLGCDALLRHLAAAESARSDDYRENFARTVFADPNLAGTLELLDIQGRPAILQEWLSGLPATDWSAQAAVPDVCHRLLTQAALGLAAAHRAGLVHGHLSDAQLLLTADGQLKICGFGEPPWLYESAEGTMSERGDLQALGQLVSRWFKVTGPRRGKAKQVAVALTSVLFRLSADTDDGYRDAEELLQDLKNAGSHIPANPEAWERLLKHVRDHGTPDAVFAQVG
jgi:hypothetical protein